MSDFHVYELEDIVWDDFSVSDDHLVPYPQIQRNEGSVAHSESSKNLRHEAVMKSTSGPSGSHRGKRVGVSTEKKIFSPPRITDYKVSATGSWSHEPDNCQTGKDLMSNLSSGRPSPTVTRGDFTPNNNFNIGASNSNNNCTAADNNIFNSLSDTQSENDFSFLYNDLDNKGVDNSLLYDWPEIGNYDLNQMLRSCDSEFGIGDPAKAGSMCWFSSSTAVNPHDASSHLGVRSSYSDSNSLKIFSENCESPHPIYESHAVDALKKRSAGASNTLTTLASNTTGQSCVSKDSSISDLPTNSAKTDRGKSLKEVNKNLRNVDYQTQSTEKPKSKTQHSFRKASKELLSSKSRRLQTQNVVAVTYSDTVSVQNSISNSENEDCLTKTSQPNEHLLEETSLLQLQEVMEQMDLKTKLCIRDSLYRLAKSAEQRHGISTMNRDSKVDKNPSDPLIAGKNHARLLDIETDTNPIDRSIAHLLFHRPSDPSKMPHSNRRHDHNTNDGSELLHCNDVKHTDRHVAQSEK